MDCVRSLEKKDMTTALESTMMSRGRTNDAGLTGGRLGHVATSEVASLVAIEEHHLVGVEDHLGKQHCFI